MLGIWRIVLFVGQATLLWGQGIDFDALALVDADGNRFAVTTSAVEPQASGRDKELVRWIKPAADVKPGQYTLVSGQKKLSVITLVARPGNDGQGRPVVVNPSNKDDDGPAIQQAIEQAVSRGGVVTLMPGEYRVASAIRLHKGVTLSGSGDRAVLITRVPGDKAYRNRLFVPDDGVTLRNLVIQFERPTGSDEPRGYVLHRHPEAANNVTLENCVLRHCELGEWPGQGLLIRDCLFERASANQLPGKSLVHRCTFTGLDGHPLYTWGSDSLAVVSCVFDGTDRGIVFAGLRSPVTNALLYRNSFRNITGVDNGCEVLLVEGGEFHDNLILHTRVQGCVGAALQFWNAKASGNLIEDLYADGGSGVWFHGNPDEVQEKNTLRNLELHGGRVLFGPSAQWNVIEQSAFIRPVKTRSNQLLHKPEFYRGGFVFEAVGKGNRIRTSTVVGPSLLKLSEGFLLQDVESMAISK
jgi:hypothetical protein